MAKKSFEEALEALEKITREMEQGELSLENSLKKFDEGVKLTEFCHQRLAEAQAKVDLLLKKDGRLAAVPFPADADQPEE